jgi:hypothetical protein
MRLAVDWSFRLACGFSGSNSVYHVGRRNSMADADFVKQMQDSLRKQEATAEVAKESTLHIAKVTETEGAKIRHELKEWIKQSVSTINQGLTSSVLAYTDGLSGFSVSNQARKRGITVEFHSASAEISYQGGGGVGRFRPRVVGNTLEYSWENSAPCEGVPRALDLGTNVVTVEKMGQVIIHCVVGVS